MSKVQKRKKFKYSIILLCFVDKSAKVSYRSAKVS